MKWAMLFVLVMIGCEGGHSDEPACWVQIGEHADLDEGVCVQDCARCETPDDAGMCDQTPCLATCPAPAPLDGWNCIDAGTTPDAFIVVFPDAN